MYFTQHCVGLLSTRILQLVHFVSDATDSRNRQARSQDFALGAGGGEAQKLRGCNFSEKSWPFFIVALKTWALPAAGSHVFEAHRTQHFWLLIERTVLLYWNQALRPNKASFFPVKIHSIDDWGYGSPGYAPGNRKYAHGE